MQPVRVFFVACSHMSPFSRPVSHSLTCRDRGRMSPRQSSVTFLIFPLTPRAMPGCLHTSYLSREPREFSCKFLLAGVNFYRFNAKNWQFTLYFVLIYAFFQCKFYSPKFCQCKKNDKYQAWLREWGGKLRKWRRTVAGTFGPCRDTSRNGKREAKNPTGDRKAHKSPQMLDQKCTLKKNTNTCNFC